MVKLIKISQYFLHINSLVSLNQSIQSIFLFKHTTAKISTQKMFHKELQDHLQDHQQSIKSGMNKISQTHGYFSWKDPQQISQYCPSQPTQTKILKKTKTRMKSIHKSDYNTKNSYYQLESTQANQSQILRQQNHELKKIIAELKFNNLYQYDHNKIKSLLIEVDQLKKDLQKIKQENQKLKLQNDFFKRANFQLKLQNNKLKNQKGDHQLNQQYFRNSLKKLPTKQFKDNIKSTQKQEDMKKLDQISEKQEKFQYSNKQEMLQIRSSLSKLKNQRKSLSKQKISTIRRLKSQRYLNFPNNADGVERFQRI